MQFAPIQYLRFARTLAHLDPDVIPLCFSGMGPPPPETFGSPTAADLLAGDPADHPALATDIAATWGVRPRQVLVQPGSHWMIYALLAARLRSRPGPVAVEYPAYEPLLRIPQALGAEVVRVERDPGDHYRLREETLEALTGRFPTAFLMSQPHNPSGAVLGRRDLDRLAAWSEASDCALISDEVYLEFLEDWAASSPLGRVPSTVAVRSLTKVMGLGTLRCSVAAGPEEWIAEAARFTDYGPVMLPGPSQWLARKAWGSRERLWQRARDAAGEGRAEVEAWGRRCHGLVTLTLPPAGIICFPRPTEELHRALDRRARAAGIEGPIGFGLDELGDGAHLWIDHLAREENVLVTPGGFFEDPLAFRLGYGLERDQVREGLARLERFFKQALEQA